MQPGRIGGTIPHLLCTLMIRDCGSAGVVVVREKASVDPANTTAAASRVRICIPYLLEPNERLHPIAIRRERLLARHAGLRSGVV